LLRVALQPADQVVHKNTSVRNRCQGSTRHRPPTWQSGQLVDRDCTSRMSPVYPLKGFR
jgi:hypothetical protein